MRRNTILSALTAGVLLMPGAARASGSAPAPAAPATATHAAPAATHDVAAKPAPAVAPTVIIRAPSPPPGPPTSATTPVFPSHTRCSSDPGPSVSSPRSPGSGPIVGADAQLPAMAAKRMPTADPTASGGLVLDAYLGLNLRIPSEMLRRHRIAVEVGLPLVQSLAGTQLARTWSLAVAWQYTH